MIEIIDKKQEKKLKKEKVHFIGIGGIGMSSLARWFLAQNWAVSGSDISPSSITQELKKEGVKIKIGQKSANISKDVSLVVYTKAVQNNNPEFIEAVNKGVILKTYGEAVGDLTSRYKTLSVTGSHGKSTTTALLALSFIKAGLDPTVIIGTKLKEFGDKNFRFGKSDFLIIEADDYAESFLCQSPSSVIITNIDREHMDFYKNFGNVKNAFLKFISKIQEGGFLILNKDDAPLFSLKLKIEKIIKKNNLRVEWHSLKDLNSREIDNSLNVPGRHNVSNALGVYALAKKFGISDEVIFSTFKKYNGAWRRMEYRGNLKSQISNLKILVYDDYAHHPTEIKATLSAFREKYKDRKIICVFQPHQAKRLQLLFNDFKSAFQEADVLILIPIYAVAGRDNSYDEKYSSKSLSCAILSKHPKKKVLYLEDYKKLLNVLRDIISEEYNSSPPPIIIMMGAGNIFKYTDRLLGSRH